MFSAPLGRGRSVRDYVQGYVRPACELWMSRVVSPRYVFGTLGTKTGRVRLRVGLSEACVRGVGVACSDLAYVFAAFFTRLGCSRLRVGRLAAHVQGRCLPSLCVRHPGHDAGAFEIARGVVSGPSAGDRWCVWRPCLCFRHPWEKPEYSKLCAGLYRGCAWRVRRPCLCFRRLLHEVGVLEIVCGVV